ncbi:MAG: TRAP transporter small permease subunit [Gammaproteobacteria bacterium]|nr:TRAP transporter small permease subunit [Gammaproteobacteria bacterium]
MADQTRKAGRILQFIHKAEDWLLILFTSSIVIFSALQILLRNLFDAGITWISPLLGVLVFWIGMLGALVATRDNAHIKINVLSVYMTEKLQDISQIVVYLFSAGVCLTLAYYALEFLKLEMQSAAKAFADVPVWVVEIILPATFALMGLRFLVYAIAQAASLVKGGTAG